MMIVYEYAGRAAEGVKGMGGEGGPRGVPGGEGGDRPLPAEVVSYWKKCSISLMTCADVGNRFYLRVV